MCHQISYAEVEWLNMDKYLSYTARKETHRRQKRGKQPVMFWQNSDSPLETMILAGISPMASKKEICMAESSRGLGEGRTLSKN